MTGVVAEGPFTHTATVQGTGATGAVVEHSDPSAHVGVIPPTTSPTTTSTTEAPTTTIPDVSVLPEPPVTTVPPAPFTGTLPATR